MEANTIVAVWCEDHDEPERKSFGHSRISEAAELEAERDFSSEPFHHRTYLVRMSDDRVFRVEVEVEALPNFSAYACKEILTPKLASK